MVGNGWPVVYGGGAMEQILDTTKKRYLESTPQVRRLPVAIALLVDQAYLEDTMLTFANSPLRTQVTQVHWQRFRGTYNEGSSGSGGFAGGPGLGGGEGPARSGGGALASGFGGEERPSGPRMPRPGGGFPGSGRPPGMPFVPSGPGSGSEYPGGFGGATVSEGQLTSGLVELTIYGVVSLYEKYSPAAAAAAGNTPPKQ
jgi:hypothetical protein